jgi:hypothetical protein
MADADLLPFDFSPSVDRQVTLNGELVRPNCTGVLVTIDAEVAPHTSDWRREGGQFALQRDIYGATRHGERGLRYQLDLFAQYGVKCVVFVEALCAGVLGFELLQDIVHSVKRGGHEVALHLHTEWLQYYREPLLEGRIGRFMHTFSEDDQRRLIEQGLENLARAGAAGVVAMRAGNSGANAATLRAAQASGLVFDSSYFAPEIQGICQLAGPELSQPSYAEGIIEVPISWFHDGVGRVRPAQLCACSSAEIENLLLECWRRRWKTVTLLTHSFELVRRRAPHRDQTVIRLHDARLLRLCRFLAKHVEKFVPLTFNDLLGLNVAEAAPAPPPRSPLRQTMRRYVEQAVGRVW